MTSDAVRLPLLHRLWRRLPPAQRRRLFTTAVGLLAPRAGPAPANSGGIAVAGELSRASGLGEGARLMLRALEQIGVPSWPVDIGPLLPAHTADLPAVTRAPPPGVPLVLHVNPPLLPLALLRLPRAVVRGRRIIGYWSWELPAAAADWHAGGRFVHAVWVPSAFTAGAVEALAPGRVRVVPHPLALAPPVPSALDRAAFGLPADAVVVLVAFNLASSFARKNPLAAVAAFQAAFGGRSDRLLLLKVGNREHFPEDFARIVATVGEAPNIRLETRTFPAPDLHALTAACDIVLSLHRSEGFGLVLAEAMLLGKPVVTTGWSGNLDFMDRDSAALVDYRLVPVADPRGTYRMAGACWAEPDPMHAAVLLRRLADDPAARAALGARGRAHAAQALGDEAVRAALAASLVR